MKIDKAIRISVFVFGSLAVIGVGIVVHNLSLKVAPFPEPSPSNVAALKEDDYSLDSRVLGEESQASSEAEPISAAKPMDKTITKPTMQIDVEKNYSAVFHTTVGDITIEFDTKNTPITSNNFIFLAKNNFYDNTIFHRVIDGFMIQGGDPQGTGAGGPGYSFADEYLKGQYTRGTVAMANAGPNTNGSQFFIMHKDYPLPNAYVIFGHVTTGLEVVDRIATAPATTSFGGEQSKPLNPVKISSIEIIEK